MPLVRPPESGRSIADHQAACIISFLTLFDVLVSLVQLIRLGVLERLWESPNTSVFRVD